MEREQQTAPPSNAELLKRIEKLEGIIEALSKRVDSIDKSREPQKPEPNHISIKSLQEKEQKPTAILDSSSSDGGDDDLQFDE